MATNFYNFLTVFTPTYNRAHLLNRLFGSLCAQTFDDFEWVIVDDGSSDSTKEVVDYFKSVAQFSILYIKTDNGGKHRAVNTGVKIANGKWFVTVDSDDWLMADALEIISSSIKGVSAENNISMVIVLKKLANGKIIGNKFPNGLNNYFDLIYRKVRGDKLMVLSTELLRKTMFKEFLGEKFITEGSLHAQYAKKYSFMNVLFINQPLYVAEYLDDGITHNSFVVRLNSINGCLYSYLTFWRLFDDWHFKIRAALNYYRFLFHGKQRRIKFDEAVIADEIPWLFAIFGYVLYLKDRVKLSISFFKR